MYYYATCALETIMCVLQCITMPHVLQCHMYYNATCALETIMCVFVNTLAGIRSKYS